MNGKPRVSIGIPVRNGERFLAEALDSLLNQTFTDLEVIVCDNASTDRTEAICREYAQRDSRVRYERNRENLGPAGNHNKCFELARGEYFRWHAHDDLCLSAYLAKCVEALDADPSIAVAYPRTLIIDEHGNTIEKYECHVGSDVVSVAERFRALITISHRAHRGFEIFGLMRASALRMTPLEGAYAHGDRVLLVRLALLGRYHELPQRLFLARSHGTQSMQTLPTQPKRIGFSRYLGTGVLPPPEWWDASRKGRINFPEWNLAKQYWLSVGRAPLGLGQQIRCYATLMLWTIRNSPKLMRDIAFAAEHLMEKLSRPAHGEVATPALGDGTHWTNRSLTYEGGNSCRGHGHSVRRRNRHQAQAHD